MHTETVFADIDIVLLLLLLLQLPDCICICVWITFICAEMCFTSSTREKDALDRSSVSGGVVFVCLLWIQSFLVCCFPLHSGAHKTRPESGMLLPDTHRWDPESSVRNVCTTEPPPPQDRQTRPTQGMGMLEAS